MFFLQICLNVPELIAFIYEKHLTHCMKNWLSERIESLRVLILAEIRGFTLQFKNKYTRDHFLLSASKSRFKSEYLM